jgi:hypothetical protein
MALDDPKRAAKAMAVAAILVLAAPIARADCVDGVRKPTPAELDFLQRAHAALVAGLPEAVRPLERNNPQRPEPGNVAPPALCGGTPVGGFSPGVFTAFNFNFSPEEAKARADQRRLLRQQIDELKKLPPDKEAEVRQLTEQARAGRRAGTAPQPQGPAVHARAAGAGRARRGRGQPAGTGGTQDPVRARCQRQAADRRAERAR